MSRDFKAYSAVIADIGLGLAVVSALAAVLSGAGTRLEIWNFRVGF